jgi:hypothetical protein
MNLGDENYIALIACILSENSPEVVLRRVFPEMTSTRRKRSASDKPVKDEDIEEMIQMRKVMTYKQVGDFFGISAGAVYMRIRNYKRSDKCNSK